MKVLTLNTHSWLEENQEEKLNRIVEKIFKESYDVIALQEVNQLCQSSVVDSPINICALDKQDTVKEDNFAYMIVQRLKEKGVEYYWSYAVSHIGYDIYDEGSAILSKTPIEPFAHFVSREQSPDDYHSRKILFGKTKNETTDLLIASCHFSWWIDQHEGFSYEWSNTMQILYDNKLPKVMMGDFNNPEDTVGYNYVVKEENQLIDAYKIAENKYGHHTIDKEIAGWEGNDGKLRIDFVILTEHFKVSRYSTVFDGKNEQLVSDHFGVEVEMYL